MSQMLSKQDLDVAVKVLADKVEFVMKSFAVQNPLNPFGPPKTLLQVYYEVKAGLPLDNAVNGFKEGEIEQGVANGSVDEGSDKRADETA